jgi:hypothetical protein
MHAIRRGNDVLELVQASEEAQHSHQSGVRHESAMEAAVHDSAEKRLGCYLHPCTACLYATATELSVLVLVLNRTWK